MNVFSITTSGMTLMTFLEARLEFPGSSLLPFAGRLLPAAKFILQRESLCCATPIGPLLRPLRRTSSRKNNARSVIPRALPDALARWPLLPPGSNPRNARQDFKSHDTACMTNLVEESVASRRGVDGVMFLLSRRLHRKVWPIAQVL
jgi:hypothetical protein